MTRSPEPPSGPVSGGDESSGDESSTSRSGDGKGSRLDRAARSWMKNGYSVRYRDPYLIQLTKRRQLDLWLLVLLVALGVVAAIVVVAIVRQLLRERWHVVELTETPDKRIIMHKMWAPRPPDD